jgi:hypothetical protein
VIAPPRTRSLHTSSPSQASVLFALGALSNSRETQHFNKLSRLDRSQHSPNLQLIKSSEVDPHPLPIERLLHNAPPSSTAAATAKLEAAIADAKMQNEMLLQAFTDAKQQMVEESRKQQEKLRHAIADEVRKTAFLMVMLVAGAAGVAAWSLWPSVSQQGTRDSAELGRKLAAQARSAIPLLPIPAHAGKEAVVSADIVKEAAAVAAISPAAVARAKMVTEEAKAPLPTQGGQSWTWKSLLWKKD